MNPQADLHFLAAVRNQTIARSLLTDFHPEVDPSHDDWAITIAFYSALHYVDCLIVNRGDRKPTSHTQRDRIVESDPVLSTIAFEYLSLKDLSQTARYQPVHTFRPYEVQQAFDLLETVRTVVSGEVNTA